MWKIQAYISGNFDGRYEVAVAATSMVEAARKMGTSVYQMRTYGWWKSDDFPEVINDPANVYRREIGCSEDPFDRWRPAA